MPHHRIQFQAIKGFVPVFQEGGLVRLDIIFASGDLNFSYSHSQTSTAQIGIFVMILQAASKPPEC